MTVSAGIGDIFAGIGDFAEGAAYDKASSIATQNAVLTQASTRVQQTQEQRKLFQVTGQEAAATASGNLQTGGSALAVIRNSTEQGALAHQLIGLQGEIDANSFLQQAAAYKGQAQSAQIAGVGSEAAGFLSFIPGF